MWNIKSHTITLGALLLVIACPASGSTLEKIGPRVRAALYGLDQGTSVSAMRAEGRSVSASGELDVFIYGPVDVAQLEARGVRVRTHLGLICTAYIPPASLTAVASMPNVIRIVGAMRGEPALDVAIPETGAHLQRLGGPDFLGANGDGVLVGAVDTGVDLDHPDFLDESGDTRLLSVWDQTDATGPSPAGYAYGTEWTSIQIDAGLATETDPSGHGTAVLSTAAGDGSATGGPLSPFTFVGMAPKADLVMVKTTYSSTHIVDGVDYIFGTASALGMDAVANLSLGYRFGPHDGTSLLEVAIDALIGPGRLVFAAAQNWRGLPYHAEVFAGATPATATLEVSGSAAGSIFGVDGYYGVAGTIDVTVRTPGGTEIGPVSLGTENAPYPGEVTADGRVYLFNGLSFSTVDPEVYLEVISEGEDLDGTWEIIFTNVSMVTDGEVDLWQASGGVAVEFVKGLQASEEMVSEPGNGLKVITVGSWTTKDTFVACNGDTVTRPEISGPVGALSPFSNPGPTRDGRVKPDIAAPGAWIGCAHSDDDGAICPATGVLTTLLADSVHRVNAGTSIATPMVAGVGALLLQLQGSLGPDSVAAYLRQNAFVDINTGAVPNDDWGYGKLGVGNIALSAPLGATGRSLALSMTPNPSYGPTLIRFDAPGREAVELTVFDLQGRRVAHIGTATAARVGRVNWPSESELATTVSGIYFVRLRVGRRSITEKLIWLRP